MRSLILFYLTVLSLPIGTAAQFEFKDSLRGAVKSVKETTRFNTPQSAVVWSQYNIVDSIVDYKKTDSLYQQHWYMELVSPIKNTYLLKNQSGKMLTQSWSDFNLDLQFNEDFVYDDDDKILYSHLINKPQRYSKNPRGTTQFDKKHYWYYDAQGRLKEEYENDNEDSFYKYKYHYTPQGFTKSVVFTKANKLVWSKSKFYEKEKLSRTIDEDRSETNSKVTTTDYTYDGNITYATSTILIDYKEVEENKFIKETDVLAQYFKEQLFKRSLIEESSEEKLEYAAEMRAVADTLVMNYTQANGDTIETRTTLDTDDKITYLSYRTANNRSLEKEYTFSYDDMDRVKKVVLLTYNKDKVKTILDFNYITDNAGNWTQLTKSVNGLVVATRNRDITYFIKNSI